MRTPESSSGWETTNGYQLVCDDDIDYPADYVEKLVDGIERHGRRAVVGFHGCVLRAPLVDYHTSRRLLHFSRSLGEDTAVHVLGTGVAGFHVSAIRVGPQDVEPGLADLWLAMRVSANASRSCVFDGRIVGSGDMPAYRDDSIYARARSAARSGAGPTRETVVARRHEAWRLHASAGAARGACAAPRSGPPTGCRRGAERRRRRCPSFVSALRGRNGAPRSVLPRYDHITEMVRASGTYYERDLLDAIRARASGGTYVDVGAHYGNHTAFFALECGADRVVAIEPNAAAVAGLLEMVAENELSSVVVRRGGRPSRVAERERDAAAVAPAAGDFRPRELGTDGHPSECRRPDRCPGGAARRAPRFRARHRSREDRRRRCRRTDCGTGARVLRRDRPLVAVDASTATEQHALRAVLTRLGYRQVGRYCWSPTWLWAAVS